jgi:hypothetical protein
MDVREGKTLVFVRSGLKIKPALNSCTIPFIPFLTGRGI